MPETLDGRLNRPKTLKLFLDSHDSASNFSCVIILTSSTSILRDDDDSRLSGVRDFGPKMIKEQANGCNATPVITN
jgi:hypothetical protein